ncbi:hypothetical protein C4K38_6269 [Pseudomonas chlororaphis subsp. piscium]|uniref:SrfA family protein n=1 Tax=Pseudomonas chlororaphis TaxID=587753 RepID=UPI0006A611FA|nr:SrfA family protein [Pseudomonas chlororaphis]AZC34184.1 hypothetical protein C4K38_6269 [Pseudomonas chlororaphis subsp. piscium]WDG91812.1 SrfA family protein [Pseudomonas chlororaphis]SDS06557.1 hypothetical protein SAMN05216585_1112 [Pseudomonas chlororaphis]
MRGALLRSGKSGSFTALGETGQPVYRAALQLREAIRRKNPDMVDHLAIPQSDELGNQIDWYSGMAGDVIPWSSATEEERIPARAQLGALKTALEELSQRFLGNDPAEQQGDKAVFGKLLKRVIHFPDENFVYLVNGKPVLTFWGFEHADAERNRDPLHCLQAVAPAAPSTPLVPPVAAPVAAAPVIARPWWRRWWWLLPLLLLLLLLLLLGLRGCIPGVPMVTLPVGTQHEEPVAETPLEPTALPTVNGIVTPGTAVIGSGGALVTETPVVGGANETTAAADVKVDPSVTPNAETANDPAQTPPAAEPTPPATPPQTPAAATPAGPALSIPANSADGVADFLNGQYRAGAGIQDRRTGKPLRLEYQFKDGKGEVTVRRANGVTCTGPVTAAMNKGSLAINSQGQAVCGDGSTYDMPKVDCRQGATSVADCTGGYGNEKFPLSMRQTGE